VKETKQTGTKAGDSPC